MENIKGVIQIIHGMCEHKKRYIHFFNYFEKLGFKVELLEHIHHGERAENPEKAGIFQNDFMTMIDDQVEFTKYLRRKYKDVPIIIFGHSMGSFIAQEHMKSCNHMVSMYILCGSCFEQKFLWKMGQWASFLLDKFYKNRRAVIIRKMIFLNSNKKIKSEYYYNTNSWLSRDIEEVKKYSEDRYCGFTYSSNFYKEFFIFLNNLYNKNNFDKIRKDIPILIISGDMDPVGLHKKGVVELFNFYKEEGFRNLNIKLYKNARHELHNEINREEVFGDIRNWFIENNINL